MQEPHFARLWESRCADRVFRAVSGGVVREGAALFADRLRTWPWERFESVSGDDVERAAHEARAAIAAGEEHVPIPLHGVARRVRLEAFEAPLREAPDAAPYASVNVPAEDVWVL